MYAPLNRAVVLREVDACGDDVAHFVEVDMLVVFVEGNVRAASLMELARGLNSVVSDGKTHA